MARQRRRIGPGTTAVVTGAAGVAGVDQVLDVTDPASARALAAEVVPQRWADNAGMLGSGPLLNFGSPSSSSPTPGPAGYSATKHALRIYSGAVAAVMLQAAVTVMPLSGRQLLEPGEVAQAALRLMEGRWLVAPLQRGRAVLVKQSGLWPALGVATRWMTERESRCYRDRPVGRGPRAPEEEAR